VLLAAPFPSQAFFYKKEVTSLADVKGMRQRAPNAMTSRLAQLMGAVPTSVQTPEIPQAMLTGTIQTFAISPTSAVDNKLWEVATHYYDANAWMPKQMLIMNDAAFQKLPATTQKAVLAASQAAEKRGFTMAREENAKARATLKEKGMHGGNPAPAFYGELKAVGETMRTEWLQKADADSKAAMADYLKLIGK
jgi:TRAP-type C4-dicarboxylate transport system substrate-binding protein